MWNKLVYRNIYDKRYIEQLNIDDSESCLIKINRVYDFDKKVEFFIVDHKISNVRIII